MLKMSKPKIQRSHLTSGVDAVWHHIALGAKLEWVSIIP